MIWDKWQRAGDVLTVDLRAKLENGGRVPDDFRTNGCTFIKDDLPGECSKTPACVVHDWDYAQGGGWDAFKAANARLYRNLCALGVPRWDAWVVWAGVAIGGAPHFHFTGGQSHSTRQWAFSAATGHSREFTLGKILKGLWAAYRVYVVIAGLLTSLMGGVAAHAQPQAPSGGSTGRYNTPPNAPGFSGGQTGPTITSLMRWRSLIDADNDGIADQSQAIRHSTTLPATCAEGDLYQDTDSGAAEIYVCTAANTWTKLDTAVVASSPYEGAVVIEDANGVATTSPYIYADGDHFVFDAHSAGIFYLLNPFGGFMFDTVVGANEMVMKVASGANGTATLPSGTYNILTSNTTQTVTGVKTMTSPVFDNTPTVGNGAGNDKLSFNAETTNPTCAAGNYFIWGNSTDTKLKKCQNGTITDLDPANAATATALASNPTDCGAGTFANAIDASGNLTCATPSGGYTEIRVNTATNFGSPSGTANCVIMAGLALNSSSEGELNASSCVPATGSVRRDVYHVANGRTYTFKSLTVTQINAGSTDGNTVGCKISVAYGTFSGSTYSLTSATMNSASVDAGGDYSLKAPGDQAVVNLGDTAVSAANSWFAIAFQDSDGAGGDTCTSAGVYTHYEYVIVYTIS